MAKADLHVHSSYSGRPSDWFLQKFGTNECYTEPELVYHLAKSEGMDFVTITDHNKIDGCQILKEKYALDVFTGCEFTTYFPEDNCKIHILVYDLDENQFNHLDQLRNNIYLFRDYLKNNQLAYSVAHATYSINQKLNIEHIEKLILLFDVFEGINGARNKMGNQTWMEALKNLTPAIIDALYAKHKIEPISQDPWIKGITGGSDDHSALYIGRTYTVIDAKNLDDFIWQLKNKHSMAEGRHNDYRSFAFILYKILYDFSKTKSTKISKTLFNQINALVYDKKGMTFTNWLKTWKLKKKNKKNQEHILGYLGELLEELNKKSNLSQDDKFDIIFDKISDIFDAFFKIIINATKKSLKKGDVFKFFRNAFTFLPGIFLSIPFFTTLSHFYSGRKLLDEIRKRFSITNQKNKKRIFWFTDSLTDLNGVSITLNKIGWLCHASKRDLFLISALNEEQLSSTTLPPNFINLPFLTELKLPHYESISVKIPSILKSIEQLYQYEPDEIYISSPGTIGLFGLLFAKLTHAKTVGVFHTDFSKQAHNIIGEQSVTDMIQAGMKWFYSKMDRIAVPTAEYINLLEKQGYEKEKMTIFKRGIEIDQKSIARKNMLQQFKIKNGINLIYAGRISQDKNLDFLIDIYLKVKQSKDKVNLIIAGDGPYAYELKKKSASEKRIYFTGRIDRRKLFKLYSQSHLFVFPSLTDTFGMVVMEAQAFGLPALVTDVGGPKEIIKPGQTGYMISHQDKKQWVNKIITLIDLIENQPREYEIMSQNAKNHVKTRFNWDIVLQEIFEEKPEQTDQAEKDIFLEARSS